MELQPPIRVPGRQPRRRALRLATASGLAALALHAMVFAIPAAASPLVCQRAIVGKFAKFVQGRVKLLQKCHEQVVIGKRPGPCPDFVTAGKIARLEAKLASAIGQRCGGADKMCGTPGDETLTSIGWNLGACPGFEGGCTGAIADCSDVAACLTCAGGAAIDQAMTLAYGGLTPSAPHDELNRCQATIGRSLSRYFNAKLFALAKCEDKVLLGAQAGPCPDAAKSAPRIARAAEKVSSRICRACGGFDQDCGGGDDFSAGAIGFPASCPAVTVPNGPSCTGPTDPLATLASCVGCVTDFKTNCLDALSVPGLKSYPAECGATPGSATPTATPTPTTTITPSPTRTATPTPTLPLPSLTLPLPTLTLPLPSLTLPLPTLTVPLPSLTLPLPTLTVPLPSLTLPLPTPTETPSPDPTATLTLPLPSLTLPLPSLTLPLPTLTVVLPTPTPAATPSCGDGIVVAPETCEQGVAPCDGLHTCVACLTCL